MTAPARKLTLPPARVRPFLKWAGGKYRLLDRILSLLPPAEQLVEPFAGSGAVFLNADYPRFVVNDVNPDLINLYRTLQRDGERFIRDAAPLFGPKANTAETYYRLREEFNSTRDTYTKAKIFLYLNRHGYNGLCRYNRKGSFNVPFGEFKLPRFPEEPIRRFLERAGRVEFLCGGYAAAFARASKRSVIYCDPPYVALSRTAYFSDYAAQGFDDAAQADLAELAERTAKERRIPVLISNHDTEFTREIYAAASAIETANVRRYISRDANSRGTVKEVLALYLP